MSETGSDIGAYFKFLHARPIFYSGDELFQVVAFKTTLCVWFVVIVLQKL